MSLTLQPVIDEFNTRIGDSTEDRITNTQRYSYLTYGVKQLKEKTLNDHSVNTINLNYYDGVNYYKLDSVASDLLEANDLNTKVLTDGGQPFTRKSSQELRAEVGYQFGEDSYSIERRDGDTYLVINHDSKYQEFVAASCDSLTENGEWLADTSTSDATNLSVDTISYTEGNGSFKFDVDVSQSGNNRATIYNSTLSAEDLSDNKDLDSWLVDFKMPSVTYITSVTFKWGSSTSDYYSVTSTTDINGNPFVAADFFTAKFDWLGATVTGTPDDEALTYLECVINYSASQADATSFYIDNIRLVRPEVLKFYYTSYAVGTDSSLVPILKFSATTDIPYFSGQYDQYKYIVADLAAAQAFKDLRLYGEAREKEADAERQIAKISKIIPKSMSKEMKSFKVRGVNFRRGRNNSRKFTI